MQRRHYVWQDLYQKVNTFSLNKFITNCCFTDTAFFVGCKIFTLDSINVCRKYMFVFDILVSILLSTHWCIVNWDGLKTIQCAMEKHTSQLLWFRKLYIRFSRYMIINSLREMNISDIELEMQINDT